MIQIVTTRHTEQLFHHQNGSTENGMITDQFMTQKIINFQKRICTTGTKIHREIQFFLALSVGLNQDAKINFFYYFDIFYQLKTLAHCIVWNVVDLSLFM